MSEIALGALIRTKLSLRFDGGAGLCPAGAELRRRVARA
jgi:hypothetical protein